MTIEEALEYWNRYGKAPPRTATGWYDAPRQPPSPPLHGAIDYRKRPDGVWEMPSQK